jgi:outer membrane protein assembly factor BamB
MVLAFAGLAMGQDETPGWSQWRGARRDGRTDAFRLPSAWPGGIQEVWKVEVGEGHSSPILHRGRIYLASRQGDDEVVLCLDPGTGKTLWRATRATPYEMHEAATGHGKGPRSTVTAGGGKVFALGVAGTLRALDAASGAVAWERDFRKDFAKTSPLYGAAMSPVLEKDLLIAHVGGHDQGALTAFDVETGEARWSWKGDGPGYASPIVADLAGKRQVVTATQTLVVGVDAASGELLWKLPLKTPYDQNSVTPVLWKSRLVLSGLERGIVGIDLALEDGKVVPREAWRTNDVSGYMSTPVVAGDLVFGLSHRKGGQLFALDPSDGKVLWKGEGGFGDNAAIVDLEKVLAVLGVDGELHFIEPSAKGLVILAKHRVSKSPTWAHPLFHGTRIWIKDRTALAALEVE